MDTRLTLCTAAIAFHLSLLSYYSFYQFRVITLRLFSLEQGTSADQDTRFSNKMKKLLKSQKFAPELDITVSVHSISPSYMHIRIPVPLL